MCGGREGIGCGFRCLWKSEVMDSPGARAKGICDLPHVVWVPAIKLWAYVSIVHVPKH